MKGFASVLMLALMSCNGKTEPAARANDVVCGTIGGRLRGNADLLLMIDLASRRSSIERFFQYQPQMVVWEPATWKASTVRVSFLDGDAASRNFVMSVASEWVTGLKLKFTQSSDADAELRLTFTGNGAWSKVGREAEQVPAGQPTMGLAAFAGWQSAPTSIRPRCR